MDTSLNAALGDAIWEDQTEADAATVEMNQAISKALLGALNEQENPDMVMAEAEMSKAAAANKEQDNRAAEIGLKSEKTKQEHYRLFLEEQKQAADIAKTKADTMKSLADAEKISGETMGQQIANIQQLAPQPSA